MHVLARYKEGQWPYAEILLTTAGAFLEALNQANIIEQQLIEYGLDKTLRVFDKSQLMSYLTMFTVFNESFFHDKPIAFTKDDLELIALINECGDETVIDPDELHALKNKLAPYYDRFINQVTKHYEFVTLDDGAIVSNILPVS